MGEDGPNAADFVNEASEAEIAAFGSALGGLDQGCGAGMELLKELLAELQAAPA